MNTEETLIHVYFMPGLAANASIFEYIKLPEDRFKVHYLRWIIPYEKESLTEYAQRMNKYVKHDHAVLIGVSFGGVVVQEMSRFLNLKRLIIISSAKCRQELPRRMRLAGKTGLFRLLPLGLLDYVDHFEKVAVGSYFKKRARLYRQYLSVRNRRYLDWAIRNMVQWDCEEPRKEIIHIHGDKDEIFPVRYIRDYIRVEGGTHVMIINRFRWFNKHLPGIILHGRKTEVKKEKKEKQQEKG